VVVLPGGPRETLWARHDQRVQVGRVDQCESTHPSPWSAGNSGGSGYASSRYSRIASD
jgi:hypothetical protein